MNVELAGIIKHHLGEQTEPPKPVNLAVEFNRGVKMTFSKSRDW